MGEQLGASAHWQFWTDFYNVYDRWWERQERVLRQLVRQTGVDPDAFQFCMDTQATPWLQGIEVTGHLKLGDWQGTPVFRLEDRGGQELRKWGGALPELETWHEVLEACVGRASQD